MKRDEILPFLNESLKTKKYSQILELLRDVDDTELFHGLYPVAAAKPYQPGIPGSIAGNLLYDLNPKCPISCKEAILALEEWFVSLEEVPFYLYLQFGFETLMTTCNELLLDCLLYTSPSPRD